MSLWVELFGVISNDERFSKMLGQPGKNENFMILFFSINPNFLLIFRFNTFGFI